jgi:hypothetical protein
MEPTLLRLVRKIIPLLLVGAIGFVAGCKEDEESTPEEAEVSKVISTGSASENSGVTGPSAAILAASHDAAESLTFEDIRGENPDPDHIKFNLALPSIASNGLPITWVSANPAISDHGIVVRPPFVEGSKTGSITATFGDDFASKQFPLVVSTIEPTDQEAVVAAKQELTEKLILGDNSSASMVATNLNLITQGNYQTGVSWTSANNRVSPSGVVTRPSINEPDVSGAIEATITKGDSTETKSFTITVLKFQRLMITEIFGGIYTNNGWVEIRNSDVNPIFLGDYEWRGCDNGCGSTSSGSLPDVTLAAGSYYILHADNGFETPTGPSESELIDFHPHFDGGFFEIISAGQTVDFAKWHNGASTGYSPTSGSFTGSAVMTDGDMGHSLGRPWMGSYTDTDHMNDWYFFDRASPGGMNGTGAPPGTDTDGDGLEDSYETSVSLTDPAKVDTDGDWFTDGQEVNGSVAGINLAALGADPNVRDIFVELDYMASPAGISNSLSDSTDNPFALDLRKAAIDKIKAVFDTYTTNNPTKPVKVHFDVGDKFHQSAGISPSDYDLGGGNEIPFSACIYLGTNATYNSTNCADFYALKQKHFDPARRFIFHYFIVGWSQETDFSPGSSGLAEINGNDGIMTIGNWGYGPANENRIINFQASTLLHELGHNFGLRHGGGDFDNYKPNYISSMNYLFQLYGLDHDDSGDVYYSRLSGHPLDVGYDIGTNDPALVIGYSHGNRSPLNEANLDETKGWFTHTSNPIGFNLNTSKNEVGIQFNVQDSSYNNSNTDVLVDHNDWDALTLDFQTHINTDFNLWSKNEPDHEILAPQCVSKPQM